MAGTTIFLLLLLYCVIGCSCSPLKVKKFHCESNPKLCTNNICNIKLARNKMVFLSYSCYHPLPLNSIEVHMIVKRKTQNSNVVLFDGREDLCNILSANSNSMLMDRVYKYLNIYGLNLNKCPIQGNVTLMNCPVDISYFPILVLSGLYDVHFFSRDLIRDAPIVNYTLQFQVE